MVCMPRFNDYILQMPPHVPQVLINLDDISPPKDLGDGFDVRLLGRCDDVIEFLQAVLQWKSDTATKPLVDISANARHSVDGKSAGERADSRVVMPLHLYRASSAPELATNSESHSGSEGPVSASNRVLRKRIDLSPVVVRNVSVVAQSLMSPASFLSEVKCKHLTSRVYSFRRATLPVLCSGSVKDANVRNVEVVLPKKRVRKPSTSASASARPSALSLDGKNIVDGGSYRETDNDTAMTADEFIRQMRKTTERKKMKQIKIIKSGVTGGKVNRGVGRPRKRDRVTIDREVDQVEEHHDAVCIKPENGVRESEDGIASLLDGKTKRARKSKYASSGDYVFL